ncbi:uncharacterized protein LOC133706499 isoform X4 [Rosa rugosa]|uniref:uncharacterized protein LOC133706499 isoform X4 n=1 Tax=Rosa rugosa TaxID=74645 RepID=UPI002B40B41D|nr:uncharacterized protein LOC133706499 isoform X4 [Rosa rugosa]
MESHCLNPISLVLSEDKLIISSTSHGCVYLTLSSTILRVAIINRAPEEMVHDFEACADCTQKCLLIHGNKKSGSHNETSFFKIMFGKQFSKFMDLPPKVARILLLSDRRTFLEDSCGLRWKVAISSVNGSWAFQQGWNAFALDHDLQVGDFLVFNYVVGSHFTVKIYDNSGCEVNLFETIHQNNRNRVHTDGQCHTIGKSTVSKSVSDTFAGPDAEISKCLNEVHGMKKPLIITENASDHDDDYERSKCKRKAEFADDMSCMIEREYGHQQGESRARILDLSSFESFKKIKICGSDGSNKVAAVNETHSHHADSSLKLRNEVSSVKIPVAKELVDRVIPSDASEIERTQKNNYSEYKVKGAPLSDKDSSTNVTSGHLFPTLPENPEQKEEIFSSISNRAAKKCQSANVSGNDHQVAVSGNEHDLIDDTCQSANKKITEISKSCDKVMKVIENKPVELTSHPCGQEVIPENIVMMNIGKESVDLTSDPCSREVIPERKDKAGTIIENVIVDLTSDQCSQEVIEKEESLDLSTKVGIEIPSGPAEFEGTEECNKSEAKVNRVPSDKDSCTETSGHPFPTHSENPEENGETTSKKATKECRNADGSELLSGKDQVVLSQKEPDLMYASSPRDNKKLTGISESIHNPLTFECQNYDVIINEKESVEVTCQEVIPQRKDTIIFENKSVEVTLEPCSQEVIPERKDTIVIGEESVDLTLDPSCQEFIPETKGESLKVFNRVNRQRANTNIRAVPSDASDLERTEKRNYSEVKVRKVSTSDKVPHTKQTSCHLNPIRHVHVEEDKTNIPKISNRGINKLKTTDGSVAASQKEQVSIDDSCQQAKKKFTGISKSFEAPVNSGSQYYSAKMSKIMEKEFVNSSSDPCSQEIIPEVDALSSKISNKLQSQSNFARKNDSALPVVKPEPIEDAGATFPSFTISCLATDRQSFLELPKSLPLPLNTMKGRSKLDRRIVYLQGPDKRLWPVLYIQKFFFRTLANGWEAFCMANNIEQGDRCTIEVTNQTEGICSVHIVKMRDDMEFYEEYEHNPLIDLS